MAPTKLVQGPHFHSWNSGARSCRCVVPGTFQEVCCCQLQVVFPRNRGQNVLYPVLCMFAILKPSCSTLRILRIAEGAKCQSCNRHGPAPSGGSMQDQYLPADVVKSTFRRLRSKADNKVSKPRHPSDRGNRLFFCDQKFCLLLSFSPSFS